MKKNLLSLKEYQAVLLRIAELEELLSYIPDEIQAQKKEWETVQARIKELEENKAEQTEKIKSQQALLDESNAKSEKYDKDLKAVTNDKEYNAVLKEIDAVKKKISSLSDDISERKADMEEIEKNLEESLSSEKGLRETYQASLDKHRQSQADFQTELDEKKAIQEQLEKSVPVRLLKLFKKIASRRNGIGLSYCNAAVCSACNVRVRQSVVDQLRRYNKLIQCESCQRILYFDEETASQS